MSRQRVLVVDDEPDIRATVEILLGRMGLDSQAAASVGEAEVLLETEDFDLVLCDMRLGDGSGLDVVRWISRHQAQTPVTVITAYGSAQDAVAALKAGAFDYVEKPVDLDLLRRLVEDALRPGRQRASQGPAGSTTAADGNRGRTPSQLVGTSAAMQDLRAMIERLARTHAPVFVCGESGTGKDLVAREIHLQGPRRDGPFVAVNCGAIPAELFESELFGHLKGSFSGASSDREGLFRAADHGTLFLDEVVDLPLAMQVKLLRALQERAVRPVGDHQEHPVDVRIVSAAQRPLQQAVQRGTLREDLYYRLNVIELALPPLRDRQGDLPQLCNHLLARIASRHSMPRPSITDAALDRLRSYGFPGNIRELDNLLERACALRSPGSPIDVADLHLSDTPHEDTAPTVAAQPPSSTAPPDGAGALSASGNIDEDLQAAERARILAALEATRWNRTRAAERLGISFRSLRYRLKKLGLDSGKN